MQFESRCRFISNSITRALQIVHFTVPPKSQLVAKWRRASCLPVEDLADILVHAGSGRVVTRLSQRVLRAILWEANRGDLMRHRFMLCEFDT